MDALGFGRLCCEDRLGQFVPSGPRHRPGRLVGSLAAMLAAGGEHASGKLPFYDFAANQAWANIATLAFNLTFWVELTALPGYHHAKAWDIKRWRYRLFATAGKIITRARRNRLLLPESAPEKDLLKLLLMNIGRLKQVQQAATG